MNKKKFQKIAKEVINLEIKALQKLKTKINSTFNCILTPHNAGVTEESNIRVSQFIAESIIRFFSK